MCVRLSVSGYRGYTRCHSYYSVSQENAFNILFAVRWCLRRWMLSLHCFALNIYTRAHIHTFTRAHIKTLLWVHSYVKSFKKKLIWEEEKRSKIETSFCRSLPFVFRVFGSFQSIHFVWICHAYFVESSTFTSTTKHKQTHTRTRTQFDSLSMNPCDPDESLFYWIVCITVHYQLDRQNQNNSHSLLYAQISIKMITLYTHMHERYSTVANSTWLLLFFVTKFHLNRQIANKSKTTSSSRIFSLSHETNAQCSGWWWWWSMVMVVCTKKKARKNG